MKRSLLTIRLKVLFCQGYFEPKLDELTLILKALSLVGIQEVR